MKHFPGTRLLCKERGTFGNLLTHLFAWCQLQQSSGAIAPGLLESMSGAKVVLSDRCSLLSIT